MDPHPLCSGSTPLHIAAREKNLFAVTKLVDFGADVNKKDTLLGRTVLHIAVEEGSVDITKYLLQKVRSMPTEVVVCHKSLMELNIKHTRSWNSPVSIVTRLWAGQLGFDSW
jgi:ankyrin repeat protein